MSLQQVGRRAAFAALLGAFLLLRESPAAAATAPLVGRPRGRPRIKLDRVTFAPAIADSSEYLRYLKTVVQREARKANWGAGSKSTISLRFAVEHLELSEQRGVLQIHCSARGELPRHRSARSQLSYGGDASQQKKLVLRVLEISARGVISRLSELERTRRER